MRTEDDIHIMHWRFNYRFDEGSEEDLNREKRRLEMDVIWRLGCEDDAGCTTADVISPIQIITCGLLPNLSHTNFESEDEDNTELIDMMVGKEEVLTDLIELA